MTALTNSSSMRELETLLNQWEARWRAVRVLRLLPRVLSVALLAGIVAAIGIGSLGLLPPAGMVGAVAALVAALTIIFSGGLRLFGRQGLAAARYFDETFGLQERMSTALELLQGNIHTTQELADFQLADTATLAREIDPRKELRLDIRWLDWVLVLLLLMVLIITLFLFALRSNLNSTAVSEETRLAVSAAQEDVRDITEDIATDSGLTDAERESLLETLEVSLDELQAEDLSSEDAFVEMSELEAELRGQAEEIREDVAQEIAAQEAASAALDPLADVPEDTQFDQQLAEVSDTLSELDEQQREEAADALEEAAQELEEEDPETAESLQDAADALRQDDTEAAQEALSEAEQNAAESQQSQQQRSASAEALESAADQSASAAEDIADSESVEQSEAQGTLPEDVPQAPGEEGAAGSQAQEGQNPQPGEGGQVETDQENAPSGDVAGQADAEDVQEGGGAESAPGEDQGGVGAGTNDASGRQEGSGTQQNTDSFGSNEADGTGEIEYEAIYSPGGLPESASGEAVQLEAAEGDTTTQQGDFQENPMGSANTPYNEVFSEYADAANRTLQSETIPLGMRDVVRDYFSGLAPEEP